MPLEKIYLESAIKRLRYYKELADKTFVQLGEADFHFIAAEENNSIAIIIQHMYGNMLSRWTDFLTSDGEKEWRKRDAEFEEQNFSKEQLIQLWEEGWKCFLDILISLSYADLEKTVHIRTEPLSVIDAINRQLAHYPYHVGQIIYVAKILKNKDWQNLSVPKGKSDMNNELKSNP
ncbi:MAG: DUF1572 family protein [Ginsengibacter sp.]